MCACIGCVGCVGCVCVCACMYACLGYVEWCGVWGLGCGGDSGNRSRMDGGCRRWLCGMDASHIRV